MVRISFLAFRGRAAGSIVFRPHAIPLQGIARERDSTLKAQAWEILLMTAINALKMECNKYFLLK